MYNSKEQNNDSAQLPSRKNTKQQFCHKSAAFIQVIMDGANTRSEHPYVLIQLLTARAVNILPVFQTAFLIPFKFFRLGCREVYISIPDTVFCLQLGTSEAMTSLALVLHTEKSEQAAWRESLLALSPSAQEVIPNGGTPPSPPPDSAPRHIWLCVETLLCVTPGGVWRPGILQGPGQPPGQSIQPRPQTLRCLGGEILL